MRRAFASWPSLPFVIPPIVLVVGLLDVFRGSPGWFYNEPYGFLVGAYVILAIPYMFLSLDAGFRAIDLQTLTEASHGRSARWLDESLSGSDPPEHPRRRR